MYSAKCICASQWISSCWKISDVVTTCGWLPWVWLVSFVAKWTQRRKPSCFSFCRAWLYKTDSLDLIATSTVDPLVLSVPSKVNTVAMDQTCKAPPPSSPLWIMAFSLKWIYFHPDIAVINVCHWALRVTKGAFCSKGTLPAVGTYGIITKPNLLD